MALDLILQVPVIEMPWTDFIFLLIAAFGGGAFGAAIGALPAFCFTGFLVIAEGAAGGGTVSSVAFGPVFGPHISFAGGAAAAAYAAKQDGAMPEQEDGGYHPAKDIAYALGTRPDVLTVGGLFGIFGAVGTALSGSIGGGLPWDPIAIMVVVSAAAHRIAFGYPLIGTARGSGLLDMTPFENGEKRSVAADGGEVQTDGGSAEAKRLAVEPWLPHQYKWGHVGMIGLTAGLLGGWLAVQTGNAFLGFGISAASLTFLNLGVEKIPVTHHMTLPASTAALAFLGGSPARAFDSSGGSVEMTTAGILAIFIAGLFGVYGALLGEVVQRVFYAHSDTHFDPPAAAIVVATLTVALLSIAGVWESSSWVPTMGEVL